MKIAGVQMDVVLEDLGGNLERMIERLAGNDGQRPRLTVFPECALLRLLLQQSR